MRNLKYKTVSVDLDTASLEDVKAFRQEQNKGALSGFLSRSSVEVDGKDYGVTETDQREMQAAVMQHQLLAQAGIETELRWHAKHEESEVLTMEEMAMITAEVQAFVRPHVQAMQALKAAICRAETKEEVMTLAVFEAPRTDNQTE